MTPAGHNHSVPHTVPEDGRSSIHTALRACIRSHRRTAVLLNIILLLRPELIYSTCLLRLLRFPFFFYYCIALHVFSLRQYSICIPIEIRRLRTDNLVDMVPATLDFQYLVQFALTGWIVRRLGNNNFTCFARFSENSIEHKGFIDQIYNIGIANRKARH